MQCWWSWAHDLSWMKPKCSPIVKAPGISQNVNCAITVMTDTDRSLAWVEFGQPLGSGKIPSAESLSVAAGQVFCSEPRPNKDVYAMSTHPLWCKQGYRVNLNSEACGSGGKNCAGLHFSHRFYHKAFHSPRLLLKNRVGLWDLQFCLNSKTGV